MKVLSFGEILWDIYPNGKYIGGAPLNFAAHFAKQGGDAYIISAVGNDDLGKSALEIIRNWGIKTDYISVLNTSETGKCLVKLDSKGLPSYNLLDNVAYDHITEPASFDTDFDALYFGSLALRNPKNRETLLRIISNNSFKEIFVDINIRKPFVSEEAIKISFENATIVKISDEELYCVTKLLFNSEFDYAQSSKVIGNTYKNIKFVIITLGEKGSFVYDCRNEIEYFCKAEKVKVASTVGAGDSFSATFLNQYFRGNTINKCLKSASRVSAYVVSKTEAVPEYEYNKL